MPFNHWQKKFNKFEHSLTYLNFLFIIFTHQQYVIGGAGTPVMNALTLLSITMTGSLRRFVETKY